MSVEWSGLDCGCECSSESTQLELREHCHRYVGERDCNSALECFGCKSVVEEVGCKSVVEEAGSESKAVVGELGRLWLLGSCYLEGSMRF